MKDLASGVSSSRLHPAFLINLRGTWELPPGGAVSLHPYRSLRLGCVRKRLQLRSGAVARLGRAQVTSRPALSCVIRPLTEEATVDALPAWATLEQVSYYWGTPDRLLGRLAVSAGGLVATSILSSILFNHLLSSLLNAVFLFYWILEPAFLASRRNLALRRFPYIGFFCGSIREVYISEAVLYRERVPGARRARFREVVQKRINVVAADPSGRRITISGPFRSQEHRALAPGQEIGMLIASDVPDFKRVGGVSDACVRVQSPLTSYDRPTGKQTYLDDDLMDGVIQDDRFVWIGDYPFVNKEFFLELFEAALGPQTERTMVSRDSFDVNRLDAINAYGRRGGQRDYSRTSDDNDDEYMGDSDDDDDGNDDYDESRRYGRREGRRLTKRKASRVRRPLRAPPERSVGDQGDDEMPWFDDDLNTDDDSNLDLDDDDQDDPQSWRYVRKVPGRRVQTQPVPRRTSESPDKGSNEANISDSTDHRYSTKEEGAEAQRDGPASFESLSSERAISKSPEKSKVDSD